jgi:hypothetical protein
MTIATSRSIISGKTGQRATPVSITKTHGIKNLIQPPLPGQSLTSKFVLPVAVITNNLFNLVFYKIHKAKVY